MTRKGVIKMKKFVKTKLAISGKSDYEEIKSIRQKYAHFGMKIAYSVAKRMGGKRCYILWI